MYIPNEFKEIRTEEIYDLIQQYPLACIVAQTNEGLIANHIPLILKNETHLVGHIALLNEMNHLIPQDHDVLCIFKDEDAYISANDYPSKFVNHKQVPTWNYQAVHIYGKIRYFDDQKSKLALLGQLTKIHEQKTNGANAWKMSDAPKEYLLEQLNQIIVFEIEIKKIQAKSKLSQNREIKDFRSVIEALKHRDKKILQRAWKI